VRPGTITRMRSIRAAVAAVSLAIAVPGSASAAATLAVEPVRDCYRETQRVSLLAQGFTPNGGVDFTRDGMLIATLQADGVGTIAGRLTLPGLLRGQRPLTYVATDETDPALTAQVTLLTTATDVRVGPKRGAPNRRLRIRARGFRGGRTLWAHIRRRGGSARTRAVRIGRIRAPCWKVRARKRLFRRGTPPGRYRVQFDTFRRYKPRRSVEYDELFVTITRTRAR
jgi:hypothetical protein